jgi:hypothetical protein
MSHTRPQKKVLATLRGLLRHVNAHFDNQTGTVLKKDVSPWTKEIMARYRAAQDVKNREEVRNLRAFASDLLAELQAVHEQKVTFWGQPLKWLACMCLVLLVAGAVLPLWRHQRRKRRIPTCSS